MYCCWLVAATVTVLHTRPVLALDNGLALVPPMGWSTGSYKGDFNATFIMEIAKALRTSLGYTYVNIDSDWWEGAGTGSAVRNASGFLTADKKKFPDGLKPVADFVHSLGLKFGLYTASGLKFCNGDKHASEGHEYQDVSDFVDIGVDFVKIDGCSTSQKKSQATMEMWSRLFNESGRPVVISNARNGCSSASKKQQWQPWCAESSNMWRTSVDIKPDWASIMKNLDSLAGQGQYGRRGAWNDPDLLIAGNIPFNGTANGTVFNQSVAQFSLWCVTSSPLITSNDWTNVDYYVYKVLSRFDAIDANQQYVNNAGDRLAKQGSTEVWAKPLHDKRIGVVLLNRSMTKSQLVLFPLQTPYANCSVYNVWTGHSYDITGHIESFLSPTSVTMVIMSNCNGTDVYSYF